MMHQRQLGPVTWHSNAMPTGGAALAEPCQSTRVGIQRGERMLLATRRFYEDHSLLPESESSDVRVAVMDAAVDTLDGSGAGSYRGE